MRKFFVVMRISAAILKLISSLGMALISFPVAKWRAVRTFDRTLRRAGLPQSVRADLIAQYNIKLHHLLRYAQRVSNRKVWPKKNNRRETRALTVD